MKSLAKHITEHFDSVNKQQTNEDQQFPVAFDYESGDYVTIKCDGDKTKEVCIVETVPGKNGESDTVTYECDGHSETIYVDDFIGKIVPTANESADLSKLGTYQAIKTTDKVKVGKNYEINEFIDGYNQPIVIEDDKGNLEQLSFADFQLAFGKNELRHLMNMLKKHRINEERNDRAYGEVRSFAEYKKGPYAPDFLLIDKRTNKIVAGFARMNVPKSGQKDHMDKNHQLISRGTAKKPAPYLDQKPIDYDNKNNWINESIVNESMKFNDLLDELKIHDGKITTSRNKYSVVLGSDVVEFEKINPTTVKYEGDKYPIADFYDDVIVDKIY